MRNEEPKLIDLLHAARQGNPDALVAWAVPYIRAILRQRVNLQDIDDLAQDTVYRMLQRLGQVDGNGQKFKAWLARLTHNIASTHWRNRYRRSVQALPAFTDDIESCRDDDTPETIMMRQELSERLQEAIRSLSVDQCNVIALYYGDGLSTDEIAELMDKRPGTVRRLMTEARRKLREMLEDD